MKEIVKNGHRIKFNEKVKDYFWKIYEDNSWEPETFRIFDRYIEQGSTYIDVGAWIGPTVLYGAQKADSVIALEPDQQAFRYLKENIGLNKDIAKKITAINSALTLKNKKFTIYTADANSSSSLINSHNYKTHYQIEGLSINEIYRRYHPKNVRFIKIDIEGFEYKIIPTLLKNLKSLEPGGLPTIYLSLHRPFLYKDILNRYRKYLPSRLGIKLAEYQTDRYCRRLAKSLKIYRYLYTEKGKILTADNKLFFMDKPTAVVATNEKHV